MTRMLKRLLTAAVVLAPLPAAAQTPTPAAAPLTQRTGTAAPANWFLGGSAGVGAVQNVGVLAGGELGYGVTDRIDLLGEVTWMQDVVTRRRLGFASTVASYLQSSQGGTATGTIKAPATYGGAALRIMLATQGRVQPYFTVGGGVAQVTYNPTFTVGNTDVTATLPQYGVTLGSDVTERVTNAAVMGGLGVRLLQDRWYVDGAFRVTSIRTTGQATNVARASATFGLRF
jgi:hypothetical protein